MLVLLVYIVSLFTQQNQSEAQFHATKNTFRPREQSLGQPERNTTCSIIILPDNAGPNGNFVHLPVVLEAGLPRVLGDISPSLCTDFLNEKFLDVDIGEILVKFDASSELEGRWEVRDEMVFHALLNLNRVRPVLGKSTVESRWLTIITDLARILNEIERVLAAIVDGIVMHDFVHECQDGTGALDQEFHFGCAHRKDETNDILDVSPLLTQESVVTVRFGPDVVGFKTSHPVGKSLSIIMHPFVGERNRCENQLCIQPPGLTSGLQANQGEGLILGSVADGNTNSARIVTRSTQNSSLA